MRSESTRIFDMLGNIEANIATTSSDMRVLRISRDGNESLEVFSALIAGDDSFAKPKGLVVNVAASIRTKRSWNG